MSRRIREAGLAGATMLCVIAPALPASADEASEAYGTSLALPFRLKLFFPRWIRARGT